MVVNFIYSFIYSVFSVQCSVFSVQCSVFSVHTQSHCNRIGLRRALKLGTVQCSSMRWTSVKWSACSVQCSTGKAAESNSIPCSQSREWYHLGITVSWAEETIAILLLCCMISCFYSVGCHLVFTYAVGWVLMSKFAWFCVSVGQRKTITKNT